MRTLTILTLLLLITASASAQMTTALIEPSAEEYLATAITAYEQIEDWTEQEDFSAMVQLEVQMRYDVGAMSYSELRHLRQLTQYHNVWWYHPIFGDVDGMHYTLVMAYINTNDIDLQSETSIRFDNYFVVINQLDFNGDGISEYFLNVNWNEGEHRAYWFIRDTEMGYQRVDSPQLWFNSMCDFRQVCGGNATVLLRDDINNDGATEVVIAVGSYCGYGFCGGHLLVLGWRDGVIEEIVYDEPDVIELAWASGYYSGAGGSPILPPQGTWNFDNIDNDASQEILESWQFTDNQGCTVIRRQTFDWDGYQYVGSEQTEILDNTLGCAMRASHQAIWNHEYYEAIDQYERVIELTQTSASSDGTDLTQIHQYAQIRLAIAFVLAGEHDAAVQQINYLSGIEPADEVLRLLVEATQSYLVNPNPLHFCIHVEQSITNTDVWNFSSAFDNYAGLDDLDRTANYAAGRASPSRSGCDASGYFIHRLTQEALSSNEAPIEAIETFGFTVSGSAIVDTNRDGVDDWMIWIEEFDNQNFFFLSTGNTYQITKGWVSLPLGAIEFGVRAAPNNAGHLLISLAYPDTDVLCTPENPQSGTLRIQDIVGDGTPAFDSIAFQLCEFLTIDDFDFESGVINVWDSEFEGTEVEWSTSRERYIALQTREERITEMGIFSCGSYGVQFCGFRVNEPELAINIADWFHNEAETYVINVEDNMLYSNLEIGIEYRRAVALEQLGRIDDAIVVYQSLAENHSDTAWGQLAALHFSEQ